MTDVGVSSVFDEMSLTLRSIGVDKTVKVLQDARSKSITLEDPTVSFILKSVANELSVSVTCIIEGKNRDDDRIIALSITCYILNRTFGYKMISIAHLLGKRKSAVSNYCSHMRNAKENSSAVKKSKMSDFDSRLMEAYKIILTKAVSFRKQQKQAETTITA